MPNFPHVAWNLLDLSRLCKVDAQNVSQSSEVKITWRTEIRRIIRHHSVSAAVISGFPTDLNWSDGHPKPSDSLLVETPGKFYLVPAEHVQDALRWLEQLSDTPEGLLGDDNLFLEWPLSRGQKYCDADGMARDDGRYC